MYDTIHFELKSYEPRGLHTDVHGSFSKETVERVLQATNGTIVNSRYKGSYLTGHLENLRVIMREYSLYIGGSFSQFVMGTQLATMAPADVERGVQRLTDLLGLPMGIAAVTRLHVANNIETALKPEAYYPYLGQLQGHRRLEQDNGLYYRTKKRQILFYDKLKQMRRKRKPILPEFEGKNLLRIELRYEEQVPDQLNMASVTASTLYDPAFLAYMQQLWEDAYSSVPKMRDIGQAIGLIGTTNDLMEYLQLQGILRVGGMNRVMSLIDQGRVQGKWGSVEASRMRAKVRQLMATPLLTTASPLVEELDSKVAPNDSLSYAA